MNNRDFTKICRVCMSEGSRDIFHKISNNLNSSSPLDRLLEKLRYVTMMKIDENDDLPRLLCDLCIVQLNVAYNFKRQAVENDTKLRQYFIENGISSNINIANTVNENQNTKIPLRVSTNISPLSPNMNVNNHSLPVTPFVIKSEPVDDTDTSFDVTNETSFEMNRNECTSDNFHGSTSKRNDNLPAVYLNGYEFNNLTPSSDIESHQNSYPSTSSNRRLLGTQTSSNNQNSRISVRNISSMKKQKNSENAKRTKVSKREIDNLSISMNLPVGKRIRPNPNKQNEQKQQSKKQLETTSDQSVNVSLTKKNKSMQKKDSSVKIKKPKSNNKPLVDTSEILINPFSKVKRRRLFDEGRVKTTTVTKLIKPKLEPVD